jgi:hypothetical protein
MWPIEIYINRHILFVYLMLPGELSHPQAYRGIHDADFSILRSCIADLTSMEARAFLLTYLKWHQQGDWL